MDPRRQTGANLKANDWFEARSTGAFKELMTILRSTKESIDLCLYVLSFPPLADVIVQLHTKGVQVRLIIDSRGDEAAKSQIKYFFNRGIPIRQNQQSWSILMHNKFAIIDKKLLINGSFNWTKAAILMNYENLIFTTHEVLVGKYAEHFEQLWTNNKFEPYAAKTSTTERRRTGSSCSEPEDMPNDKDICWD